MRTRASSSTGVSILAGDTKVVRRGQGGGLYLATTGIGVRTTKTPLGLDRIQPGDHLIVSGTVGDHGAAVILAREEFNLSGTLRSDAASVLPVTQILQQIPGLRFMRDPTRGGLASTLNEFAQASGVAMDVAVPSHDALPGLIKTAAIQPLDLTRLPNRRLFNDRMERDLIVRITGFARDPVDGYAVADDLVCRAHAALMADPALGDLSLGIAEMEADWQVEDADMEAMLSALKTISSSAKPCKIITSVSEVATR